MFFTVIIAITTEVLQLLLGPHSARLGDLLIVDIFDYVSKNLVCRFFFFER